MKPIVKWPGGKIRLLPELVARMPREFRRYIEPFAGGAALFFHLEVRTGALLADVNAQLVQLYQDVAWNLPFIELPLQDLAAEPCTRARFESVRDSFNRGVAWPIGLRSAVMLYLNRTCFNGLWRVNSTGQFNTPWGKRPGAVVHYPEQLAAASALLREADIRCDSFPRTLARAGEGDFVYCDPPYAPASETADFTAYAAGGFDPEAHRALERDARQAAQRGARVMLSNSDTPFVRELYGRWASVESITAPRSIGASGATRGRVGELIIRSYA